MAPLSKLIKRGAVPANDLPFSNDLEAWPDSSVGRAPTYNVRDRDFEFRSGRLFSRTFTFHFEALLPKISSSKLKLLIFVLKCTIGFYNIRGCVVMVRNNLLVWKLGSKSVKTDRRYYLFR